jgi:hypothetical protein
LGIVGTSAESFRVSTKPGQSPFWNQVGTKNRPIASGGVKQKTEAYREEGLTLDVSRHNPYPEGK